MTQNKLIVALIVVLIAVVVTAQRPQSPPYSISLDERVAKLEAKIEELEAKVEELSEKGATVVVKQDSWVRDKHGNLRNMTAENQAYNATMRARLIKQEQEEKEHEEAIQEIVEDKGWDRAKAIRYLELQKKQAAIKEGKQDDRRPALSGLPRPVDPTLRPPIR